MPRPRAHDDDAGGGARRTQPTRPHEGRQGGWRAPLPTDVTELPPLPPAFDAALRSGCSAVGIRLTDSTRAAIAVHVQLLLAWNTAINLTSIREPAEIAVRHVVDSLTPAPFLAAWGATELLDLGSGGGFPGLPLAAFVPLQRTLLVDSVAKKAAFLAAAASAVGRSLAAFGGPPVRLEVAARRAEELAATPAHRERWAVVTARAVGSLAELVELAFPLLAPGGRLVAWKRGAIEAELAAGGLAAVALGGGTIRVEEVGGTLLAGHRLVVATKTGPTPPRFPRDPAARSRAPWLLP